MLLRWFLRTADGYIQKKNKLSNKLNNFQVFQVLFFTKSTFYEDSILVEMYPSKVLKDNIYHDEQR